MTDDCKKNEKNDIKPPSYSCIYCDFNTRKKTDYDRHLTTLKHTKHMAQLQKNEKNEYSCKCNKIYKHRQGLWNHKIKCSYIKSQSGLENNYNNHNYDNCETNEVISHTTQINVLNQTENKKFKLVDLDELMTMMKQNQEFKEFMIEHVKQTDEKQFKQMEDFKTQMLELAKEGRNTIINNTTNMTNSFNLNVYLNETCKNAMNMLDYVNSLELDLTDLEETGKLGYTNGMSRIFINGLKDMDVNMRPIHCSDLKREVLYIKDDNVWEKDNENRDKLKGALRKIEKKNIMLIPAYIKAHPNCVISSNRENTPYLKMVMQSTGGENPAETADMAKIITNIAKAVVINK